MDTLLIVLAVVLLLGAVAVLVIALRRPKKPKTESAREDPLKFAATMPQFGPRQLGPGAIVAHGGIDYVVRGTATLRQGPFVWWEHLLEGGSEPLWFSVEEDEGRLELVMWTRRKDASLQPGGDLVLDGISYRETERGGASFTTEGTTGLPAGGEMEFVDYADADESSFLGFERWAPDMPWEVSVGKPVLPGELTVYPAPPPTE
ncbi:hypothetical protein A5765_21945 [Mycolicibacterium celeriflavum]|uniref:DUF4178 domain-containing protein n=1 Tax=Mycolicibacterium celeriflavum TaxID=1249101 RepID=A0A1X0BMR7_MYCCF|nr:DUF4178 domain-containing protein [Mycolicibacterium celeriflavum]MCV7240326.1 DUF4178 domain-containing protein [Mycolicibacterium celeriflavum]OBG21306.1 hypothetical protein A5765_21945 [Mycolicibacterium celeriflavum]ORA44235.1 hypothetical protein BST21_20025 [Mycolicibacterium celeriflavum]BBY43375.1 hypothetical protein MCEL_16700 [Mycolicibacterium celeriflavum]